MGKSPRPLPSWLLPLLVLLVAGGIVSFFVLLFGTEPARAWQVFLVNFIFWSGLAMGGVVLAAIFQVTNARWPTPVKRLAEACAAYLPVSFLFFLVTWFGRHTLFPWGDQPIPAIASWLDFSFFFGREAIILLLLYGVALLFFYRSVLTEANAQSDPHPPLSPKPDQDRASLQKLAVVLLILYAFLFTVFAWDFIMSLHPEWSSTLFGGFFFVGNLYLGLATITVLTIYARWRYNLGDAMNPVIFHNLGKLLFSFSLLWTYLFWSQYLVIWYGNLPREIGFVLVRTEREPWSNLAIAILIMNFLIPFVILLSRTAKENRKILLASSVVIIVGMWLERFLLVVPSLSSGLQIPLGWAELLITASFFASFALTYLATLHRIAILNKF
ncbi:MAG: polysulfide reductase NrfD [Acidobacteria bacterium]|nr:polysulfide reductase NrfD [Acidobacteriota bacterium]